MQSGLVKHFTFIPMLTKPDGMRQERKTDRRRRLGAGKNEALKAFLDECVRDDRRNIKQLEGFFAHNRIRITISFGGDTYFYHPKRQEYFG